MLDKRLRSRVSQGLAPIGKGLERAGISANLLTVVGLVFSVVTALLIANGNLRWAVLGLIASGFVDLLDGAVARRSGQASPRGAFFDSVTDRVSDAVVLGGVAWYLAGKSPYLSMLAFAAAALSMLVSYERARAEGLMERAERMVLLGFGLFFDLLVPVLWVMIALTALTAVQRFIKVWRQASDLPARPKLFAARHRRTNGAGPDTEGRVPVLARWREQRSPEARREARRQARAARRSRP